MDSEKNLEGAARDVESNSAAGEGTAKLIALRAHLTLIKKGIFQQISSYPAPIPACDAQFNYLLAQRDEISRELAGLEVLFGESPTQPCPAEAVDEFIASSSFIADETALKLKLE